MKIADDILESKHCELWTVDPEDSVQDALFIMAQKKVGALLVVQDERLLGILSESDYVRKIVGLQLDPERTRVREIMTRDVVTATPTTSIEECMRMMTRGQFRHLPILIGDDLVGLISINDIVRALMGGK
jgi:CBS domain-containing protein